MSDIPPDEIPSSDPKSSQKPAPRPLKRRNRTKPGSRPTRVGDERTALSRDPERLAALRQEAIDEGLTVRELARRHDIIGATLIYLARRDGWPGPISDTKPDPASQALLGTRLRQQSTLGRAEDEMPRIPDTGDGPSNITHLGPYLENRTGGGGVKNAEKSQGKNGAGGRLSDPDRPGEPNSGPGAGGNPFEDGWSVNPRWAIRALVAMPPTPAKTEKKGFLHAASKIPDKEQKRAASDALTAVRAMMTIEQVNAIEYHEALLRRYAHMLEIFFEPTRFVVRDGEESEESYGDRVMAMRKLAADTLMPSSRDTMAGAIKTMIGGLKDLIGMKRTIAGMSAVRGGAIPPGAPMDGVEGIVNYDMKGMHTGQMRVMHEAMELLSTLQKAQGEPPRPPPPDPLVFEPDPEEAITE